MTPRCNNKLSSDVNSTLVGSYYFFKKDFIYSLRESEWGEGARESQADSPLSAEPDMGLGPPVLR